MKHLFKGAGRIFLAFVLLAGMSGCGGTAEKNEAPFVEVEFPYIVAAVGDAVELPRASVTDEETLTASVAVYKGTEKVADVTDGRFAAASAGEYIVRYTAADSRGLEGSAEGKIRFVDDVLGAKIETAIPAGGSAEIRLGAAAINAATGKNDGAFDASDYDYMYSDVENSGTEAVVVGTRLTSGGQTADLAAIAGSGYEKMAAGAASTKTLRFTSDYLIHKSGISLGAVSSVAYFVRNDGESEKNVSLTVKNFVLGRAAVMESAHFKAVETEDSFIDAENLKALFDLNGETALDYIREVKVTGSGSMSTAVTQDKGLRLTVTNGASPTTCQWHFFSYESDAGISEQGLLKRDLSGAEYLVMVFERDAGVVYGDATICLYLQSDEWGTSWNLACPYHGLNNMWFGNVRYQDGENENLVYYYLPIAEHIENEQIQSDWCANVDTLILQVANLPVDAETGLTVHGIYWC